MPYGLTYSLSLNFFVRCLSSTPILYHFKKSCQQLFCIFFKKFFFLCLFSFFCLILIYHTRTHTPDGKCKELITPDGRGKILLTRRKPPKRLLAAASKRRHVPPGLFPHKSKRKRPFPSGLILQEC